MYQSPDQAGPAVTAPPLAAPPLRPRRRLAATPWLLLLAGVLTLDLGLLQRGAAPPANDRLLQAAAAPLEAHLALLHGMLAEIARQPTTQDLLETDDADGAQRWALQLLRFLPPASDAALITLDGRSLGADPAQALAPYAVAPLLGWPAERLGRHIPVYPAPPTRFDLLAPVQDEAGNPLGLLRVGFDLREIEALLQQAAAPGRSIRLTAGDGTLIARIGDGGPAAVADALSRGLAHSDWRLSLSQPAALADPPLAWLAGLNLGALLITAAGLYVQQRRRWRGLQRELDAVNGYLGQLAADEARPLAPDLQTTAALLPPLEALGRNLHRQRQQLARQNRRDPLTGLLNRRQFNEEFSRAYDFARRSMPVCVALVRITGLDALPPEQADQALRALSRSLLDNSRKVDLAARLGHDRFALLLFDMKTAGVMPWLQRLQQHFRGQLPAQLDNDIVCGFTLIQRHRDNDPAQVLLRAEAALAATDAAQPLIGK